MSDCENVWLAIRVVWWFIITAGTGVVIFGAGYQRGRRVQAEETEQALDETRP